MRERRIALLLWTDYHCVTDFENFTKPADRQCSDFCTVPIDQFSPAILYMMSPLLMMRQLVRYCYDRVQSFEGNPCSVHLHCKAMIRPHYMIHPRSNQNETALVVSLHAKR